MSSLATVPQTIVVPEVAGVAGVARPVSARRGQRRKWLGALFVAVVLSPGLLALPPVWHGVLRAFITWQADRCGYELTVGRVSGGPFSETSLDHLRVRGGTSGGGTDLAVARARFALAWRLPWLRRSAPWMKGITLEGVRGTLDLAGGLRSGGGSQHHPNDATERWLPENFAVQADDFRLRHGPYSLRASGLVLSGKGDGAGEILTREVRAEGPGFTSVFAGWRGQTFWKDHRLTLIGLDLGNGITLASAMLDASQIGRRRLDWDCSLHALGGEARGQGAIDFSRPRLAVEVAATLRGTALAPLARMVGVRGTVDGRVEQASCTFRGDPENLSSAQMSLSVRATDFCWGDRRWQSLDTQAVVVNRRVQLHRFDLRQDGNRLSLSGEYPLPPDDVAGLVWTGDTSWWRAAGFSCNVDARLEDLHALTELIGPDAPELAGRMSVNGKLSATPGSAEVEGYLNVEGTRLTIRGAPLDFLRSTLLFRDGAMEVADVQATHDADYFTAHGVVGLCGDRTDRRGEVRAEIRDMTLYAPALAGLPGIGEKAAETRALDAVVRFENGAIHFDRWDGEPAESLLAR